MDVLLSRFILVLTVFLYSVNNLIYDDTVSRNSYVLLLSLYNCKGVNLTRQ